MANAPQVFSRPVGKAWLVGAGPGDPELLTLKAVRVIGLADVLLVDDLVNPAMVDPAQGGHARPDARIVHVGKRGGCKSTPQAFIEKMMVAEARAGRTVVRLKGGDPFIFGRGGEEVEALRAAGVEVGVVNGITAGLAAAAALDVPLTHRAHAKGVLLVTGHAQAQGPAARADGTDWKALAQTAQAQRLTLVIYMGVSGLAHIQSGLLQGLPADTPAALIENASLPQQRHVLSTLANLADDMAFHGIQSPAVVVVGDVLKGARAAQNNGGQNPILFAEKASILGA